MARTLAEAVLRSREILQDQREPYRYTDEQLIAYYNQGLVQSRRLRPDAWLAFIGKPFPVFNPADLTLPTAPDFPIDDMFFDPVVYYMVGYAEMRDDEHTVNQRMATLMASFASQLTTPQGTA